jgi:hypothetical protein
VDHGFDQRVRAWLSTLEFDAQATDRAAEIVTSFLRALPTSAEAPG